MSPACTNSSSFDPVERNLVQASVTCRTNAAHCLQWHDKIMKPQKSDTCPGSCLTLTSLTTLASSIPSSSPSMPVPAIVEVLLAFSSVTLVVSDSSRTTSLSAGPLS